MLGGIYNATPKKNYLFWMKNMNEKPNTRHELSAKFLPTIRIKNLTVNLGCGTKDLYLYRSMITGDMGSSFDHHSKISIDGFTIISEDATPVNSIVLFKGF